ncbi:MAG: fumarylacetoacetate hydrolase family protein [Prevotella sp.]|nr:fumarylacetoacetate hydrolase family protein [Prevotella sp.]
MKIFAIGKNYILHNQEIDGKLYKTAEPVVFMKPESAVLKNGKPFFLPDHLGRVDYETELVVRICRLGKNVAERFAHRYYDAVTVGIDFTARDLQRRLKDNGHPWEISKAFDGSAALGEFVPLDELAPKTFGHEGDEGFHFHLDLNGQTVQQGCSTDMLYHVDELIAYISRFFTLKTGDLLYTGTPVGVGPVKVDDHLEGYLEGRKLLDFWVK